MRKPVATLEWLLSRPCKAGKRAAQAVKVFSMPSIGDNELRVIYLKRMGYGFKAIGKRIGIHPQTTRDWLIRAGFTCNAGTKSPAYLLKQPKHANRVAPFMSANDWGNEWRGVVDDYLRFVNRGTLHRKNPYKSGTREYVRHWITMKTGKPCLPMSEYLKRPRSRPLKLNDLKNLPRKRKLKMLRQKLRDFIKSTSRHPSHLFGCSAHFMRQHIESQFKRGMTWEN